MATKLLRWALSITVLAATSFNEVHLWGLRNLRSAADTFHAPRIVLLLLALLAVVLMHSRARSRPSVIAFVSICLVFFVMSLRSWSFNGTSGEMTEYWAGLPVGRDALSDYGADTACYQISSLFLSLSPAGERVVRRYFLGVWPSRPSDEEIERALPFRECVGH